MMEKLITIAERYPNLAEEIYPILAWGGLISLVGIGVICLIDDRNKKKARKKRGRR